VHYDYDPSLIKRDAKNQQSKQFLPGELGLGYPMPWHITLQLGHELNGNGVGVERKGIKRRHNTCPIKQGKMK